MPAVETYVIVALLAIVVLQALIGMRERIKSANEARLERADLMHRIIAKDAREYAMLTRVSAPVDNRVVYTTEDVGDVEKKDDGLGMSVV